MSKYLIIDELQPTHPDNQKKYTDQEAIDFITCLKALEEIDDCEKHEELRKKKGIYDCKEVNLNNWQKWCVYFCYKVIPIHV